MFPFANRLSKRNSSVKIAKEVLIAVNSNDSDKVLDSLNKCSAKKRKKILSTRDSSGQLAIHVAASLGNLECVKSIIEEDSEEINSLDGSQWTPLLCAAANEHFDVCTFLLSISSCNAMAKNKSGTSALHHLARKLPSADKLDSYTELLEKLFSLDIDVNIYNNLGETPLHQGSMRGNLIAVTKLLENGASVNQSTINDETALHFAIRGGSEKVVDLLLDHGADIKAMGKFGSALDVAISTGQENMISKLSELSSEKVYSSSSKTPNLSKVLNHPEICLIFFSYLQKQYCAENLSFFVDIKIMERLENEEEILKSAKGIIDKYIKEGSLFEVNIDSNTRNNILSSKEYSKEMFAKAFKEVMLLLENDSYPKFINSVPYKKFLEGKTVSEDNLLGEKGSDLKNYFIALIQESRGQKN